MEQLYYEKPYTSEFESKVISCDSKNKGFEVILEKTAFYPEGGGQPSDTGTLNQVNVLKVHERGGQVIHITDAPLLPGTAVVGVLNWERRFSNMQQHSGEHIVSGLIHRHYGYDNVGFHMGSEEMTIDLNGILTWAQLMEIEQEANAVVYQNLPVEVTYPSSKDLERMPYRSKKELTGQVRIVVIPDADVCACCGTHVGKTGEIGLIKFLSMIHYKGGVRIYMLCGKPALMDYERKTEQMLELSVLLSAKPERITEAAVRLKSENSALEQRLATAERELFQMKAERYMESSKPLLVWEENQAPVQLRRFCDLLLEKKKGSIVAVCSVKPEDGCNYCIGSRTIDMQPLGKALNDALSGRGGGSSQMVQGTFLAEEKHINKLFAEMTAELN